MALAMALVMATSRASLLAGAIAIARKRKLMRAWALTNKRVREEASASGLARASEEVQLKLFLSHHHCSKTIFICFT